MVSGRKGEGAEADYERRQVMLDLSMFEETTDKEHQYLLAIAYREGQMNSDDTSTKNGVVVVSASGDTITGWNHLVEKTRQLPERLERPHKYHYTEHAERNAIYNAAKKGILLDGATMYGPWIACVDCARAIINSGITTVVAHEDIMLKTPERWEESIAIALGMMKESGIRMLMYKGRIGRVKALFDGDIWEP
jgi:dCMP deaminase